MNTIKIIALGGKITLDDISQLDQTVKISIIIGDLKEDLFQASFPAEQILDIGWYPEFCEGGQFRISLILNQNWEKPDYTENAKSWAELETALDRTLEKIKFPH
jgi:hypothetical protein